MIINRRPLENVFQTAQEMRRLTLQYWRDLGAWLDAPFISFFNFVCALPYVEDPPDVETVSRPLYLLDESYEPRDCDDKAILIASWLHGHGLPVRFVGVSTLRNKELCHVFTECRGLDIDATYPEYHGILGKYPYYQQVTHRENLTNYF